MTVQVHRAAVLSGVDKSSLQRRLCRLQIWAFIASCILSPLLAHGQTKLNFDIDSGPAPQSLAQYAQQAGVQLGFSSDAVSGLRTNPVKGEYSPDEALSVLLAGTGLVAETGDQSIVVLRAKEVEKNAGQLNVPAKSREAQSTSTPVRDAPEEASTPSDSQKTTRMNGLLEEILVTGSRIRGSQTSSPVISITRSEIANAGFSSVEQIMERLPQNFGGGANPENFSDSLGPAGSRNRQLTGSEVSIDLRGLGPDSTLVLLNGRRLAQAGLAGSFVDVSSIPIGAVDRIEVLTDGASAIYGADAIAGVVNFILIDDYNGAESRVQYGPNLDTNTSDFRFSQLMGTSWSSGNVLVSYDYYEQANLDTADRPQAASSDLTSFGGDNFDQIGGHPGTINAGGTLYAIPPGQNGASLTPSDFTPGTFNLKNRREGLDLRGEQARHNLFFYLEQEVSSEIDAFMEVRYASTQASINTVRSTLNLVVPETNAFFVDPSSSNLPSVVIQNYSILKDIGPKVSRSEIDTYGAALGGSASIAQSWDLSVSASFSAENAERVDHNIVNLVELNNALAQSDPALAFNPFADGSNTDPQVLGQIRTSGDGVDLDQNTWSLNLDLNGSYQLFERQLSVASGVEYREESISGVTREGADTGTLATIPGIDRSRRIVAGYAELFVPLVGPSGDATGPNRLEFSLAGRYVHYSDFGENTSPKLGLAWSPSRSLTIRGTVGRSFKPPLMTQLDTSDPRENVDGYVGVTPLPAIFRFGGNEELVAQESTNWTAGFLFSPQSAPDLRIAATYFDIDFEDRIQVPPGGLFDVFGPEYSILVNRAPTREEIVAIASSSRWQGFGTSADDVINGVVPVEAIVDKRIRNVAKSNVSGVDLQINCRFDSGLGAFDFSLNGSYLIDNDLALLATLPSVSLVNTVSNPAALRIRSGGIWSMNRWQASSFINFTNSYTDTESVPERPISSWTTVDVSIAYELEPGDRWFDGTRIGFTVQNAFDRNPPIVNRTFGLAFDPANASIFGRYIAVQVKKEWR